MNKTIWACYGCDQMYGGLHGMEGYKVIEGTENDAEAAAIALSDDVISSYQEIMDELTDGMEEDVLEDEYGDALEDAMLEDRCYTYVEVRSEFADKTVHELNALLAEEGWDEFTRQYCVSC